MKPTKVNFLQKNLTLGDFYQFVRKLVKIWDNLRIKMTYIILRNLFKIGKYFCKVSKIPCYSPFKGTVSLDCLFLVFYQSAHSSSIRDVLGLFQFCCFFIELLDFLNNSLVLQRPQSWPKNFGLGKIFNYKSNVFVQLMFL